ncbi:hypothetical protein H4R35_007170, partial [Dimargaris xerosporica]
MKLLTVTLTLILAISMVLTKPYSPGTAQHRLQETGRKFTLDKQTGNDQKST